MRKTTNYPSDLSDEEWAVLELQIPKEMKPGVFGRPRSYSVRELLDGCLYIIKSGCQ
jgi:putative transposase